MNIRNTGHGFITVTSDNKVAAVFTSPIEDYEKPAIAMIEDETIYYPKDIHPSTLIQLAQAYPTHRFVAVDELCIYLED